MAKQYIVTAGSDSTDLGVAGYSGSLLGAKRIGRRAVRESLPNAEGGYSVKDQFGDVVFGEERSIRTDFRWV